MGKEVEVSVKSGVYVESTGRYFIVEFGEAKNVPAIKVTGGDENYEETVVIGAIVDGNFMIPLLRLINSSEYLGEL